MERGDLQTQKTVLVIVQSLAHNDPRVRRQLTWLANDDWAIDTIGLGSVPSDEVRDHFELVDQKPWVRSKLGVLITYLLLPKRVMFRRLSIDRVPEAVLNRIADGHYSLVVFNDIDFLRLAKDPRVFTSRALGGHLHADIHEYREPHPPLNLWRLLTLRYYKWQRDLIGDSVFDTRSTVASGIAELYALEFSIDLATIVRSAPSFHDQQPTETNPAAIRMLHHGLAHPERGFAYILDAMRLVDDRFTMTVMVTGHQKDIDELRRATAEFGSRVQVVPPVPMSELSEAVNQYDIEIMFFPTAHRNLHFALPNKSVESYRAGSLSSSARVR